MKFLRLLPAVALIFLTGCISRPGAANTAKTGLAAAAGAAAGYALSDGELGATLGGAAAAGAAQAYANNISDKKQRADVARAYAAGEAKATRDLYEAIQRNQSVDTVDESADEDTNAVYLPIAAPPRIVNGVRVEGSIEYIRINDGGPNQ